MRNRGPEAPRVEVLERLHQLGTSVHHEWTRPRYGLANRRSTKDEHLHPRAVLLLLLRGSRQRQQIAGTEHGQLTGADRRLVRTDETVPAHDVDQRVEVPTPGQVEL